MTAITRLHPAQQPTPGHHTAVLPSAAAHRASAGRRGERQYG